MNNKTDINFELYKVFYYVATTLSFSEAAGKLFISPVCSQSVHQDTGKETESDAVYSQYKKKSVSLRKGRSSWRHIEPAVAVDRARAESQLFGSLRRIVGQLRIGQQAIAIRRYFLVPYLEQFHKAFPGTHIKVTNATSIRCVELLRSGQVDLIVVNFPNSHLDSMFTSTTIHEFQDVFIADETFKELRGQKCPIRNC